MKSIVTFQMKGSNYKTSLTGTLGQMLSKNHKVLVMDNDHQSNLTVWLTGNDHSKVKYEFADVMTGSADMDEAIIDIDGLHLLGSLPSTGKIINFTENTLPNDQHIFLELKEALEDMGYDYVIWDLSPSFSLLNRSILLQADTVLTPISPEFFSLVGLNNIFDSLDNLAIKNKRVAGVKIPKPIVAVSGFNGTVAQHNEVVEAIKKNGVNIASQMPVDPIYRKAQAEGVSIFDLPKDKPKKDTVTGLNKLVEVLK